MVMGHGTHVTGIIAAAGNLGTFVEYPARYNNSVIAVGAVYPNDTRCEWSNTGPELEFVAPGVDIYSTHLNEGYTNMSGTSLAVPHVTAVAALIWSSKIDPDYDLDHNGGWSNNEVREKLKHLCLDLGPSGRDAEYGYGLINGWATIQRPLGDINMDYKVDMKDLGFVARYFGAFWPPPNPTDYNLAIADITIDNKVDLKDMGIVARNFGKIDP